jgi:hypothetical protein
MKMDREMLKRHLAKAEAHIEKGWKILTRQRELIAELERDGHDTAQARTTLKEFEELQAMHISGRETVLHELAQTAKAP